MQLLRLANTANPTSAPYNQFSLGFKKSIEQIYKVEVIKVNTILSKPKAKVVRGKLGSKTGYKKAIVTLKEGQTIDMTAGV